MVSQSFYKDLSAARKSQQEEAKKVVVQALTKAGQPSKMNDAIKRFHTEGEAMEYINRVRALNPKSQLRFTVNGIEA